MSCRKGCKCSSTRLSAVSLGVAFGVVTGLWMLLFALFASQSGHGTVIITQWADIYQGYAPTTVGALAGLGWGFIEGFVTGLVLGWIYNLCRCCCRCCTRCPCAVEHSNPTVEVTEVRKDIV
jgi:hypothetical protein